MSDGFRTDPVGGGASPPYTGDKYSFDADLTFTGKVRTSPGRYSLEENFLQLPNENSTISIVYNLDFELLGMNADIADFSWDTTAGGVKLETGSADNDQVIILPHLDTKQTAWTGVLWGTENQVVWEAQLRTSASVANILLWAGLKLTNDPVIATDNDQIYFRFDTDVALETTWQVISSIGGTDTTTDSGVTVAASTNYNLRIEVDSARKAHFYINDALVYITTALTNDIDLIPYVGVQQLSSGDASVTLCYEKISRIIFE